MQVSFLDKTVDIHYWDGEKLGNTITIDTETRYIVDHEVPELVLFQAFDGSDKAFLVKKEAIRRFLDAHKAATFVFHNAPFDIEVISKECPEAIDWHYKMENDEIRDTAIMYRLWILATLGWTSRDYGLARVTETLFDHKLSKSDDIRLNFGNYMDEDGTVYYDEIPKESIEYAMLDVLATHSCYLALAQHIREQESWSDLTHNIQLLGAYALNRIENRGVYVDPERWQAKVNELEPKLKHLANVLATYGWVQGAQGIQDRYEWIVKDYLGLKLPVTDDGKVSSAAADLEKYSDYPFVAAYIEYQKLLKLYNYVIGFKPGRNHPRYDYLLTTGRTASFNPNIQNPPREGGARELVVPGEGHCFIVVDYSFIELCTLAQTTFTKYGKSRMREIINDGIDPHKYLASSITKKTIDLVSKGERQAAKAVGFGRPGGLGDDRFIEYAEITYGVKFTKKEAKESKELWYDTYPEMHQYMNETTADTWTITGRKRANASYCASKNTPFQGLAADGAKIALYMLEKAGFEVVVFLHDEVVVRHPTIQSQEAKAEIEKIMLEAMQTVCPDVKIGVEGHILPEWRKC